MSFEESKEVPVLLDKINKTNDIKELEQVISEYANVVKNKDGKIIEINNRARNNHIYDVIADVLNKKAIAFIKNVVCAKSKLAQVKKTSIPLDAFSKFSTDLFNLQTYSGCMHYTDKYSNRGLDKKTHLELFNMMAQDACINQQNGDSTKMALLMTSLFAKLISISHKELYDIKDAQLVDFAKVNELLQLR